MQAVNLWIIFAAPLRNACLTLSAPSLKIHTEAWRRRQTHKHSQVYSFTATYPKTLQYGASIPAILFIFNRILLKMRKQMNETDSLRRQNKKNMPERRAQRNSPNSSMMNVHQGVHREKKRLLHQPERGGGLILRTTRNLFLPATILEIFILIA